jgi:hypothetical protein
MARCHRIGQSRDVTVYRLVTRGTYEQELFQSASRKYGLDEAILGFSGAGGRSGLGAWGPGTGPGGGGLGLGDAGIWGAVVVPIRERHQLPCNGQGVGARRRRWCWM